MRMMAIIFIKSASLTGCGMFSGSENGVPSAGSMRGKLTVWGPQPYSSSRWRACSIMARISKR